ncbi:AraC family transcriptional regulator [Asticcacaulis benevestitus]|nr:AraC family transcriptional regulator [Asticcacaulis benevestitus]
MTQTLYEAAKRFADMHADANGVATTPFPGVVILREPLPTTLQYSISKPMVALVLQGCKRVTMGQDTFDFGAGQSLLITTDVPTVSQITTASAAKPYYSLVLELDRALIEALVSDMGNVAFPAGGPVRIDPTDVEVADAALRLLRLLDRPASIPVLKDQHLRELHFWLLSGRYGGAIRALGIMDSHAQRIGRAVSVIRADFAKPLRGEQLAEIAGMSISAFHAHFRNITSLTPLQFQKQLRLIEARRAMLSGGATINTAAFDVGYESVHQFTREYGRLFGRPPASDMKAAKQDQVTAA